MTDETELLVYRVFLDRKETAEEPVLCALTERKERKVMLAMLACLDHKASEVC